MASLTDGLAALFQAPFDDTANVTPAQLVTGYRVIFLSLASYAAEVDAIPVTTHDRALRQAAADIFITTCLTCGFAALAEALAAKAHAKAYATAEDIDADLLALNGAWDTLAVRSFDADLRAQLSEILTRTTDVLHQLEVTLPRITSVDAPEMPASVLSYWLYDTDAKEDTMIALNPDAAPWFYSGATTVLSY